MKTEKCKTTELPYSNQKKILSSEALLLYNQYMLKQDQYMKLFKSSASEPVRAKAKTELNLMRLDYYKLLEKCQDYGK